MVINTGHDATYLNTENGYSYIVSLWHYGSQHFENVGETTMSVKKLATKEDVDDVECEIDLPNEMYVIKGSYIEIFKYGCFYVNKEFIPNEYTLRVVNINDKIVDYWNKIIINCPSNYAKDEIKGNDYPLFQVLDKHGKVVTSKYVHIYVADTSAITNKNRNVMFMGDSLTGMGYRTKEIANLIASNSLLSNTSLVGRSSGSGTGNKFTGTGGYSWNNYADNPSTLPSDYPNNYLWDPSKGDISFSYLINQIGASSLDYLFILLGWNDYESGAYAST